MKDIDDKDLVDVSGGTDAAVTGSGQFSMDEEGMIHDAGEVET